MVTYKIVLDTRRAKADGTYAVQIRITCNRQSITSNTGVSIDDKQWDTSSNRVFPVHPNANLLNKRITEYYLKVQRTVLEIENDFSFEELKHRLSETYKPVIAAKTRTFPDYAQELINELIETNKSGNALVYKVAVKRFNEFHCNPKLRFVEINYQLLDAFKHRLVKDGVKQNTISNYFRTLRAIYNKAIKAKLVDKSNYPFLDIRIKTERTAKRALDINDLRKFVRVDIKPQSQAWHARNYFFLSFTLIGMSFTDIAYLTDKNIKKNRLIYRRRKTKQQLSIKISPYAKQLLDLYKGRNSKYLLPILHPNVVEDGMQAKLIIMQAIKQTNKYLNRIAIKHHIEQEITTYVARHSWATTAKRLGCPIEVIAEAMGHEHGNRITNIYLDTFDQKIIDAMNDKVIISVVPCPLQILSRYRHTVMNRFDHSKYHGQRLRFA